MRLAIADLDEMTMGMVFDISTELSNDSYEYPYKATQEDINSMLA